MARPPKKLPALKPPHCGHPTCDKRTRLRDHDTYMTRCPLCHPTTVGRQLAISDR